MGDTPMCDDYIFESDDNIHCKSTQYRGTISSRLCSDYETDISELLQNIDEMFPRYLY